MCWTPVQLYKPREPHVAGHLRLDGCWKEWKTLSWCEKHPLRCLTPDVTLSFSHAHTATWSSAPKNPNRSHSLQPSCTSEVNVSFDFLDRLTETFVCLFVFWLAISRLGFPMMIMTCMIGMCYLLATHIGLGWNMWVRAGGRERERERYWDQWKPSAQRRVESGLDWASLQAPREATWRRRLEGPAVFSVFSSTFGYWPIICYFLETSAKTHSRCFNSALNPFYSNWTSNNWYYTLKLIGAFSKNVMWDLLTYKRPECCNYKTENWHNII